MHAGIRDISRGGIALTCGILTPAGTEVQVDMPSGSTIDGRVVQSASGNMAIAFRQDAATLQCIDQMLDIIARRASDTAA